VKQKAFRFALRITCYRNMPKYKKPATVLFYFASREKRL